MIITDKNGTILSGHAAKMYKMEHDDLIEIAPDEFKHKCSCKPKETCPTCKDEKVKSGISPKHDAGKLRYSLVPPIAIEAMADVLTFGAEKYAPNSWQGVENGESRYTDALYRHLEAYRSGEEIDDDSKKSHLSHAITNIAFLLHFQQERKDAN